MTRLIGLYPRRWRERYGDEFADLLEGRPASWSDRLDLLRGAVDAHRHPELVDPSAPAPLTAMAPVSPRRLADLRIARRLGFAAMAGTILWLAAWAVATQGPIVYEPDGTSYRDGGAAMPIYMFAVWGLTAGLVGQIIRLPSRALVARAAAFISALAFSLYALGPWLIPLGAVGLGGFVVLALAAWWAGHWSGLSVAVVGFVSVVGTWFMALVMNGGGVPGNESVPYLVAAVVLFASLWLVVGASLLRLPPVDDALGDDGVDRLPEAAIPA